MFKKIDKYLLENHPVVWNTKFVWMLIIGILYNLMFFGMGLISYHSPVELQDSQIFYRYFTSSYVWFGILSAILILILWLNHYFKHNAFKSLYPKSNFSLYKEFLIIFSIVCLIAGTYFSFTKGFQVRVANVKTEKEILAAKDLYNRVAPFTLQVYLQDNEYNPSQYAQSSRCLPLPIFDSLVNEDRLLRRFVANQYQNNRYWKDVDTANYKVYRDSLAPLINQNSEYDLLLLEHFPSRKNWFPKPEYKTADLVVNNNYSEYEQTATIETYVETTTAVDSVIGSIRYNLKSIYNYCHLVYNDFDSLKNAEFYAKQTHNLLKNNQKDSIQKMMIDYLKLADDLEVGYRFKDKNWIDYVYNPPYYFVDYELQQSTRYNQSENRTYYKDYIHENGLRQAISNIDEAQTGIFKFYELLTWLYVALFISLLIFTFRMTSTRAWVVSIVGSIVVFFIYISIFFIFMQSRFIEETILGLGLILLFFFVFWLIMLVGVSNSKWKLASGVNLNWVILTLGAIVPTLLGLYSNIIDNRYPPKYEYDEFGNGVYNQHPHSEWISDHFDCILLLNFFIVLIAIFVLIPIIKKWQSMADE